MVLQKTLLLFASFFLFASFILELFVIIGHLSNKPFLDILYFVQANNPDYNLSYSFGLWSYCQGGYNAPIRSCSQPVSAYNWATTPGFDRMFPGYAFSANVQRVFTAFFVLYFIGMIFSFLLWVMTLPFALFCCCSRKLKRTSRTFDLLMTVFTCINLLVMVVVLIIAIILVVDSVKAVSRGPSWYGKPGISLWFTIASVVSLFLASVCYLIKSCCSGKHSSGTSSLGRVDPNTPAGNKHAYRNNAFDLTHQTQTYTPAMMNSGIQPQQPQYQPYQASNTIGNQQPHQQQYYSQQPITSPTTHQNQQQHQLQQPYSISSLSQQYSPGLQPQYLTNAYDNNSNNQPSTSQRI